MKAVRLNEPGSRTNLPGRALMAAAWRGRQHAFIHQLLFGHLWMDEPQTARFAKTSFRSQPRGVRARRRSSSAMQLIGRELAALLVSRKPIQYEYRPRVEAILLGPQRISPQPVRKIQKATEALERSAVAG